MEPALIPVLGQYAPHHSGSEQIEQHSISLAIGHIALIIFICVFLFMRLSFYLKIYKLS